MQKISLPALAFLILISTVTYGQPESLNKYSSPLYIDPLNINVKDYGRVDIPRLKAEAEIYYNNGEYIKAAKNYLLVVNNWCDDNDSYYRLSRCYARLGEASLATDFLTLAIEAGYVDYAALAGDDAFRKVRRDQEFRNVFEMLAGSSPENIGIFWVGQTRLGKVRIVYPEGYDPGKSYPLLIALHGRGGNAVNFSSISSLISKRDIIIAIPEGPYSFNSVGTIEFVMHSWDIVTDKREVMQIADPLVVEYIADISSELKKELNISRTYLMGFSQGAAYAYAAGIRFSERFDGLICFGGTIPDQTLYPWFISDMDISAGNSLKVFVAHGLNDQAINSDNAARSVAILEKNGYNVKQVLFEGGHYVPGEVLNEAIDWLSVTK